MDNKINLNKEFDPICLKNMCFSLADKLDSEDPRQLDFYKQRIEKGFDDSELWNLDTTILKFILPRLKVFKEITPNFPNEFNDLKEWTNCIQKMIDSIESIINDDDPHYEGWELFKQYFFDLRN
jgi:hypothetical protein